MQKLNQVNIKWYMESSLRHLEQFPELMSKKLFDKASEELWGALTSALNAMAISKGQRLAKHHQIRNFAKQLAMELKDPMIFETFEKAETLHANFYHGFLDEDTILEAAPKIEHVVKKMLSLVSLV